MPDREPFGERLAQGIRTHGNLCVGIDPHPALLDAWGLNDDAGSLERFSLTVLDAVAGNACIVKPQVALYERHGSKGFAVLERVLAEAAERGLLTIADAKRGDIGSTMEAYADAWIRDGSALAADAVTLSPYLGFESLRPALDTAAGHGRGIFVLALTSNPEGASIQHVGGNRSVARNILEAASRENAATRGPGSVGVVVGATVGDAARELGLDFAALNGPVLAPGIGAQGAGGRELRTLFGNALPLVLGSASRSILSKGPSVERLSLAVAEALRELAE